MIIVIDGHFLITVSMCCVASLFILHPTCFRFSFNVLCESSLWKTQFPSWLKTTHGNYIKSLVIMIISLTIMSMMWTESNDDGSQNISLMRPADKHTHTVLCATIAQNIHMRSRYHSQWLIMNPRMAVTYRAIIVTIVKLCWLYTFGYCIVLIHHHHPIQL